jgi:hypothetical protein
MKLKIVTLAVAALLVTFSGSAFAGKASGAKHVAVGTVTSVDANQIVINEKVKGKDQPMTFQLDSATQKSGNVAAGSTVTIQYRTENNKNIATTVRERLAKATKGTTKTKTTAKKS